MGRTFAIDAVFERSRSIIFNSRLVVISIGKIKLSAAVIIHDRCTKQQLAQKSMRKRANEQARNTSGLERDMFVRSLFQRAISKTIAKAGMRITRHDPKRSKHSQEQSAQSTERAISVFETAMSVVRWSRAAARISTHRVSICQMHSTCRSWPCN